MHTQTRACTFTAHTYTQPMHTCIHIVHACTSIAHVCTHSQHTCAHSLHPCAHTSAHKHTCVHNALHTCAQTHAQIYTYARAHKHIPSQFLSAQSPEKALWPASQAPSWSGPSASARGCPHQGLPCHRCQGKDTEEGSVLRAVSFREENSILNNFPQNQGHSRDHLRKNRDGLSPRPE